VILGIFASIKLHAYRILTKLNSRNLELSNTNNELDKFVYSASHDLRAPISSLKGLVSISKFENDPVKLQSYFDLMNQTLDKQDQFIKDIIDYSLNKKNELNLVPVNLSVMIDEAVNEHLYMPGASEIKITKELTAMEIQSDPKRLSIVINNLISNAFKYQDFSKSEKTLIIRSRTADGDAFIEVEDNGIGIPPKHHAHIFEMFYVVTAGSKGSGLGLYITKETINKLGGDIFVSSKINFGTKFTIRLPQPARV
jgi:signal transduction histidine kinase